MNTYGMRWLMPFSGRWFYGDSLFIVDPWMWIVLGAGVFLSRRRARRMAAGEGRTTRPARVALALTGAYIVLMLASTLGARAVVRRELASRGIEPTVLMVDPLPVNPLPRRVVYGVAGAYQVTEFSWFRTPHVVASTDSIRHRGG